MNESYPILSTSDRGVRMTQLLPGRPVGEFSGGLVVRIILTTAIWAVASTPLWAAYLSLQPDSIGSPWAFGAGLVVAYFAIGATLDLAEVARETFGQARASGWLACTVVAGGFAVSGIGWVSISYDSDPVPLFDLDNIATSPTLPRELAVLVAGAAVVWAAVALGLFFSAVGHARDRQQTITRLRTAGRRHDGVLTELEFRSAWLGSDPLFRITVGYDVAGEARVVQAHMRTTQDRVPVVGSPMVVLTDDTGAGHVELDLSGPVAWEADDGRYAPSDG